MNKLKPILELLKSNLVSVIAIAVAVIALPTMFVVSRGMTESRRKTVEAEANKQLRDLSGVKVEYALEPLTPGTEAVRVSMPPNQATTDAMAALLERSKAGVSAVQSRIVAYHAGDRTPLVEGLFPAPADVVEMPIFAEQMVKAVVPAHEELLRRFGVGMPPDRSLVAERLEEIRFREEQTRRALRADGQLTADDLQAIMARLSEERLNMYSARALETRFYGDMSAFGLPTWTESAPPPLETMWDWQWAFWCHEDLVSALAKANASAGSVLGGPVKHLERIDLLPLPAQPAPGGGDDRTAEIGRDFTRSLTGRGGWPMAANPLYDVRYADVTLLVSSGGLPGVIDAISTTNLMTVIGFDGAAATDLVDRLRQGFVYTNTDEHVIRVKLRVEMLFLRDWLARFMPVTVQSRMGFAGAPAADMPAGQDAGDFGGGQPPSPRRGGGDTPPGGGRMSN